MSVVDLKALDPQDLAVTLSTARQEVCLKQGVDTETTKSMVKLVKGSKLKVQAQILGGPSSDHRKKPR